MFGVVFASAAKPADPREPGADRDSGAGSSYATATLCGFDTGRFRGCGRHQELTPTPLTRRLATARVASGLTSAVRSTNPAATAPR